MEEVGEEERRVSDGRGGWGKSSEILQDLYASRLARSTQVMLFGMRTASTDTSCGRLRDGQPGGANVPSNQQTTWMTMRTVAIREPTKGAGMDAIGAMCLHRFSPASSGLDGRLVFMF